MKQRAKESKKSNSLRILMFFFIVVCLLVGISLLLKLAVIVAKSTFDGQHRFTIAEGENPLRIYSFAPDNKTISVLEITAQKPVPIKKLVKMPIDATIAATDALPKESVEDYVKYLFFHSNTVQTNMTVLDFLRLWLFVRTVDPSEIRFENLHISKSLESSAIDTIVKELFSDHTLIQESKSIQVINGTGISGLGNDFSRQLINSGGNVISVTSAHTESKKTYISYYGQSSYTLKKIESIFGKKAKPLQKRGIADIIIVLGKDIVRN